MDTHKHAGIRGHIRNTQGTQNIKQPQNTDPHQGHQSIQRRSQAHTQNTNTHKTGTQAYGPGHTRKNHALRKYTLRIRTHIKSCAHRNNHTHKSWKHTSTHESRAHTKTAHNHGHTQTQTQQSWTHVENKKSTLMCPCLVAKSAREARASKKSMKINERWGPLTLCAIKAKASPGGGERKTPFTTACPEGWKVTMMMKRRKNTRTRTPQACTGTATTESCTRGEAAARLGPCRSGAWRDIFSTEDGDAGGQQNKKKQVFRLTVIVRLSSSKPLNGYTALWNTALPLCG